MRRALHDAWWRLISTPPHSLTDHLLSGFLRAGAGFYEAGVALRNAAYDREWLPQARLPCPVISVGNLAVGGTGKTTCVEYLANTLTRWGRRVCVLSRGYGVRENQQPYWLMSRDGQLLLNDGPLASLEGLPDEPQLLASHLPDVPVVVGARRELSGRLALAQCQAEVLLLDDGFQHRRLHRDCEIVLVNARMPLGGWDLLPRGPLREPLSSLRRADVIVLTKADQSLEIVSALQERLQMMNPSAVLATAIHEPQTLLEWATGEALPLERLANTRVGLLSSIGDPEGFEQTARRLGATIVSHVTYPDHHQYASSDWQETLKMAAASGARALVTTEKDLIRLQPFKQETPITLPVWVVGVTMQLLTGEAELNDRLARVSPR